MIGIQTSILGSIRSVVRMTLPWSRAMMEQLGRREVFQPGSTCSRYWDTRIFLHTQNQAHLKGQCHEKSCSAEALV